MATYHWVGGNGTWNNSNTANWSLVSGGAGGAGYPVAGDTAIFNAASGAAVVTLGANVTLNILTMTGFTGTLKFETFGINLISTATTQTVYTGAATYSVEGVDPTITVTVTGTHNGITYAAGAVTETNAINVVGYGSTFSASWLVSGNVKDMLSYGLIINNTTRTVYRNYGQFPNAGNASRSGSGNSTQTTFAGSGTQTITCNGNEIGHWFGFAGTGTIVFADAFLLNVSRTLAHTSGTINANNMNVTVGNFTSTGATARTINMGSGTWTLLSSTWTISGSNYTLNCNTSTVLIAQATTNCNFTTGDATYHNIIFQGGVGSICNFTSNVSCTVNDISNNVAPARIVLPNGTTLFVNGNFNLNGTSVDDVLIAGSSDVSRAIISKVSGTVNCQYLGLGNLIFQGGASWNANHSWANLTTGITVTNTDTRYWVGGNGTWDSSSTANWSLTSNGSGGASVPTAATRVVFSSESGGGAVTIGTGAICRLLLFQNAYFNVAGQHSGTIAFGSNFIDVAGENRTVVKGSTATAFTGTGGIRLTANASSGRRECQSQNSLEANSPRFWVTAGTDTVTVFEFTKGLNFTGFSGTLLNASRTVFGDFVGSPTMLHSASSGAMSMRSSVPAVIDCAGCTLDQPVAINSTSTYTLSSNLTLVSSRVLTMTAGTLNGNGFNVTCNSTSVASGFTLNMGSGTWSVSVQWSVSTGVTLNAGTSTVNFINGAGANFAGTGYTYYRLNGAGTAQINILGSNTFNDITHSNAPGIFNFSAGTTTTVSNFSLSGRTSDIITLQSASNGVPFTISKASGTVNATHLSIKDCTVTGGATWNATYSTGVSGNSGWNSITNAAKIYYWVGGGGTWNNSNTANWSLVSGGTGGAGYPLADDEVIFNGASGGGTCVIGATVNCKTLTMTGYTGLLEFGVNKIVVRGGNGTVFTGSNTYTTGGTRRLDFAYPGRTGTRALTSPVATDPLHVPNIYITAGTDSVAFTSGGRWGTIDFTGASVLVTNTAKTIYGSFILSPTLAAMGGNQTQTLAGTGSHVIDFAGCLIFAQSLLLSGTGTYTLQSNIRIGTYGITLSSGGFDANNYNVTMASFSSNVSNVRTLTMGSGTWDVSGSWTIAATNLTFNRGTSTILFTGASAKTLTGGGLTYFNIAQGGSGTLTIAGSNGFNDIQNPYKTTGAAAILFTSGTTQTVSNFTAVGELGRLLTIASTTPGSAATLSKASGIVTATYLSIKDIAATGGAAFKARVGAGNVDAGGNSGWSFMPQWRPQVFFHS